MRERRLSISWIGSLHHSLGCLKQFALHTLGGALENFVIQSHSCEGTLQVVLEFISYLT